MVNSSIAVAKDNTIRVSSLKLGNITRLIVNLKASKAIDQLKFSQKRISMHVLKVLNAAIANAENNNQLDIDSLILKFESDSSKKLGNNQMWFNVNDLKSVGTPAPVSKIIEKVI